jgi:hypothetical protein
MPLYLDEIWLAWSDKESARRTLTLFRGINAESFPFPEGVRLVAGPWFSNEEPKIILILDIQDHTKTFPAFGLTLVHGAIARRRLTPIVEWSAVQSLLDALAPTSET